MDNKQKIIFTPCNYYTKRYNLTQICYKGYFLGIGYEGNLEDGIDTFHIIVLEDGTLIHAYDPKIIKFIELEYEKGEEK